MENLQIQMPLEGLEIAGNDHLNLSDNKIKNEQTKEPEAQTNRGNGIVPPYVFTADRLLKDGDDEQIPLLVEDMVPNSALFGIVGSSDTGKSLLAKHLCLSIVERRDTFLGLRLNVTYGSAIYVTTEDDVQNVGRYLKTAIEDPTAHPYENLRVIQETEDLVNRLEKELERQSADLLVIDVFTDLYNDDMNSANRVRQFLNKYQRIAMNFGVTVCFLHHTGKRTDNLAPHKSNVIGSQGFESKCRCIIELRRDLSDRSKRHVCIVKANYLPDHKKEKSIVLELNDRLHFEFTGERVPLEQLGGQYYEPVSDNPETVKLVLQYHDSGLSYRGIEEKMRADGYQIGKSTVAEIVKRYKN